MFSGDNLTCSVCLSQIASDKYFFCQVCKINLHLECAKLVKAECKKAPLYERNNPNKQTGAVKTKPAKQSTKVSRVSQKIPKTGGSFWSGFIYYYTKKYQQHMNHYWKLDSGAIHVYNKDMNKAEKKLYEIPLISISKVAQSGINTEEIRAPVKYLFLLKTDNEIYFCGDGTQMDETPMNALAKQFYNIFKLVYLPYQMGNECKIKKTA